MQKVKILIDGELLFEVEADQNGYPKETDCDIITESYLTATWFEVKLKNNIFIFSRVTVGNMWVDFKTPTPEDLKNIYNYKKYIIRDKT